MKCTPVISADAVKVHMEEPVLVDQAPPEVKEWGRWRMPKIYRMPTGGLGLTFSICTDHYSAQGLTSPLFVSTDEGRSWQHSAWPHAGLSGMAPVITPIQDGEYYSIPTGAGIELDVKRMPKSAGMVDVGDGFPLYRLDECPDDVVRWFQNIQAMRWSPKTMSWTREPVRWDHRGQLVFAYNDRSQKIPGCWSQKVYLESPIVRRGTELLHADYWTQYETLPDRAPLVFGCKLMVSTDNARSWTRRSAIAGQSRTCVMCEPVIEINSDGGLVCVMRADAIRGNPLPAMCLVHSNDRGHTWSQPETLPSYGVFPRLLQLENGVMALSYGRAPGTWVAFSLDGGHSWTQPSVVLAPDTEKGSITGNPADAWPSSCGYTSLLALSRDTFLLAYGNRHLPNAQGQPCKSILVRRISVQPSGE